MAAGQVHPLPAIETSVSPCGTVSDAVTVPLVGPAAAAFVTGAIVFQFLGGPNWRPAAGALRQWNLTFDPNAYGAAAAEILALDQDGERLIPLISGKCSAEAASIRLRGAKASSLFPSARSPDAALAGLWLYFSCLDECHELVQNATSPEAHLWHAILHRQEPDSGNAAYWFRKAGPHAIFNGIREAAEATVLRHPEAEFRTGGKWDPFSFIMFCERARQQPDSAQERAALEIQRTEWQLLFDHCARPKK